LGEFAGASWLIVLVAAIGAGLALAALAGLAPRLPLDRPGSRSLHDRPVPRIGGVAIWAGALPAVILAAPELPGSRAVWLLAWAAVAAVSLIDDCRSVRPAYRLAVQTAAAIAVAAQIARGHDAPMDAVTVAGAALGTLAIVWSANLYNFMDGSDGLAATMSACGFAAYGIAAWHGGAPAGAYFALVAATLPFLALNVPPARMFMGDVGAVPLGFLAAAFGLGGWSMGRWPAWFPLLVFLPFVADASVTLARRLWRRERVWEAHRMHYYQRLHRLGAGHLGTLAIFGVLIAGTVVSALVTLATDPGSGWIVTAAWGGALAALFCGIDYIWRRHSPNPR
jgi:UDP-N-acetylmuramyl pentapeptide phosphotransferase/UDP-N-acetylglucosamine-1-phosphate transferase